MTALNRSDFKGVNFGIIVADIDGGFYKGGTTIIINMQSKTLFIDNSKDQRCWPIRSFEDAISQANKHLQNND